MTHRGIVCPGFKCLTCKLIVVLEFQACLKSKICMLLRVRIGKLQFENSLLIKRRKLNLAYGVDCETLSTQHGGYSFFKYNICGYM